jgi:HSP20 family protein
MNERTQVTNRQAQATPDHPLAALIPPVDVIEDESGITVTADLPGVTKDRLNIKLDSDNLTIEGAALVPVPEGMALRYAEIRAPYYRRNFTLSRELDTTKIDASLKDGVLKLRIPKTAEAKPRQIEVKLG